MLIIVAMEILLVSGLESARVEEGSNKQAAAIVRRNGDGIRVVGKGRRHDGDREGRGRAIRQFQGGSVKGVAREGNEEGKGG